MRTVRVILASLVPTLAVQACDSNGPMKPEASVVADEAASPPPPSADASRADERRAMVRDQLEARDIEDPKVLSAMLEVPRHAFVPAAVAPMAYEDRPLPIGHDVTISQPYIVALMTQLAQVQPGDRVLDVGTGSGYQAAVLAHMGAEVYGVEIIEPLAQRAALHIARLGYDKVRIRAGDGYRGWPEHAPFDAIILAAAPDHVPPALREQLAIGGRLVLPVGKGYAQQLVVITRAADGYTEKTVAPVMFVPMTGEAQKG